MIMSHTLIQLLDAEFDEIHVAAPHATVSLAERMPEVKSVTPLNIQHGQLAIGERWRAGRDISRLQADAAYVLPNSWKSALLPFFAGVPRRVGWHGEARYVLLNERYSGVEKHPLMIERFMALSGALPDQPYPKPRLEVDEDNRRRLLNDLHLESTNVVALAPGAEFGQAKKWPVEHYASIAETMVSRGRQVWLFGSPGDVNDCDAIAQSVPSVTNLAGKTSLLDAIDLLSVAAQLVCNDSGLMHVGSALGVPTIGVFGSTSPNFTPPLGEHSEVVELELDCRPCFARVCPLGHTNCLHNLKPERVLERIAS